MGDFVGQWIRNIVLDDNNEAVAVREFDNAVGGVVSIAVHPFNGALYYISWATFVNKVEWAPTANQAPTAIASSDVNFLPSPLPKLPHSPGACFRLPMILTLAGSTPMEMIRSA